MWYAAGSRDSHTHTLQRLHDPADEPVAACTINAGPSICTALRSLLPPPPSHGAAHTSSRTLIIIRTCPAAEGNNACEHMRMRVQHHHVLLSTRHAARAPRGPFVALGRSTLPTASARQSQRPRLRAPRTEPVHTRPPAAELVTPSLAHAWPAHPLPRQAALCGSGDGFPHGPRAATGSAPPACCPSPPVAVPSRS